jgi:hypothetical protein
MGRGRYSMKFQHHHTASEICLHLECNVVDMSYFVRCAQILGRPQAAEQFILENLRGRRPKRKDEIFPEVPITIGGSDAHKTLGLFDCRFGRN